MNEIRVLASIKHRNIVRYCDAFVEKDSCVSPLRSAMRASGVRSLHHCSRARQLLCCARARCSLLRHSHTRRARRLYIAMEFAEHGDIGRQIEK